MTTNGNKLDAASTVYSSIFSEALMGSQSASSNYKKWCKEFNEIGRAIELDLVHGFGLPTEWNGSRLVKSLRASKKLIRTKDYQVSHNVSKLEMKQQPTIVGDKIRQFCSSQINYINSLAIAQLVTGGTEVQTDIDNVAFFASTHPMDDGTTQSNTTTSALSQTTYRAAAVAMRGWKDRGGMPLGVKPSKLIVGPGNEYVARDILESKVRTQGITAAGAVDAAASMVAAAAIDNTVSNDGVEIIVDPFLVGTYANYWFLVGDLAGAAPMIVNIAQAPTPTDNTGDFLNNVPEYIFSIESQLGIGFGLWQTCYGGLAT
jgi:phage major head subunit gpT-like protein